MNDETTNADANPAPPDETPGGLGGAAPAVIGLPESILPGAGIRDTRQITKALTKGYPIDEKYLGPLVNRQIVIATDQTPKKKGGPSRREQTSAFRAILAARQQNLEIEERDNPRRRYADEPDAPQAPTTNVQVNVVNATDLTDEQLARIAAGNGHAPKNGEANGSAGKEAHP